MKILDQKIKRIFDLKFSYTVLYIIFISVILFFKNTAHCEKFLLYLNIQY